jgi:hypothetical protein
MEYSQFQNAPLAVLWASFALNFTYRRCKWTVFSKLHNCNTKKLVFTLFFNNINCLEMWSTTKFYVVGIPARRLVQEICPSFILHEKSRLCPPRNIFSWLLMLENWIKVCLLIQVLITSDSRPVTTNSLPRSITNLKNEKTQFKVTLKKFLNAHSFYSVDEFFTCTDDKYCWLYDCVIVSYTVTFLLFVCLWHVPHPIVLWLLRIYGMYICMYVCIYDT